jgi:hypothetical protein
MGIFRQFWLKSRTRIALLLLKSQRPGKHNVAKRGRKRSATMSAVSAQNMFSSV